MPYGRGVDEPVEPINEQQLLRLTPEGYASDGAGVARLDGRVIFVAGGLRGEPCTVKIDKVGRSAIWGHVTEVLAPAPARLVPDCPHYALCGGCQLRHMTYEEELDCKRRRVEDALQRIGGTEIGVSVIHGAKNTQRYRNKVQFPVSGGPRGPQIGFYRARSHSVIDVADCLLQPEAAGLLRAAVLTWMRQFRVPAYDERSGKGLLRHLYLRRNRAGETLCCLLVHGKNLPHEAELVEALRAAEPNLRGIVLGVHEEHNNVILGDTYRTLWGEDFLYDSLCGLQFKLSVPSFYQVNSDQAELLYARALALADLNGSETVLDLYCGIGTISLVMAQAAGRVIGCEVVPEAIRDAKENALRNGISNAEFICGDAGAAAGQLLAAGIRPEVICVDPPRKGLAPEVIDIIAALAPQRLVYVSCDPGTLARDVKLFAQKGYTLKTAEAVDLFPRTAHVETVTLLTKDPY
ncbi:MAG: 23S rRNA (uracil(1939)-C(5))-methyltransferase RlmD [Pseudoflavonifractor sp.]